MQTGASTSMTDLVLVMSLGYLCFDLVDESGQFARCSKPVHVWLVVSYLMVMATRMMYMAGMLSAGDGASFLLNLRQQSAKLQSLLSMFWVVGLPLFSVWTLLGTVWCMDVWTNTPDCLPEGAHFYFLIIWQVLSYLWICVHAGLGGLAWMLERSVRRAEGDLRVIEDDDVRSRWGEVSRLQGYTSLTSLKVQGLRPEEIKCLPCHTVDAAGAAHEEDCSVCLSPLCEGESCRELPGCGHVFHRGCIDLWLLRTPSCPLCKGPVEPG